MFMIATRIYLLFYNQSCVLYVEIDIFERKKRDGGILQVSEESQNQSSSLKKFAPSSNISI